MLSNLPVLALAAMAAARPMPEEEGVSQIVPFEPTLIYSPTQTLSYTTIIVTVTTQEIFSPTSLSYTEVTVTGMPTGDSDWPPTITPGPGNICESFYQTCGTPTPYLTQTYISCHTTTDPSWTGPERLDPCPTKIPSLVW
ncbi:hypothetical protein F4778DRAFT_778980 [Xylariomycetidae sp. FL2044]|nr:hypothetical protein F4778DRAFT_778980 [Xylariomycetidae sp. FL2044]